MVNETVDPIMAEAATRRAQAEAEANYAAQTQATARLPKQTMFVNMDTGEISYGNQMEGGLSAQSAKASVTQPRTANLPQSDPSAYFRHARLGVVAAIVLVLFWLWIRERRAQ